MSFPLPTLQKREEVVEVQFSPEQIALQLEQQEQQKEEIRRREDLSRKERADLLRAWRQETKQARDDLKAFLQNMARDANRRADKQYQLNELKDLFGKEFRTGRFAKIGMLLSNPEKAFSNTLDAMKGSITDKLFGKTIGDLESDQDESMRRTTLLERAITGEKYAAITEREPRITANDIRDELLKQFGDEVWEEKQKGKPKPQVEEPANGPSGEMLVEDPKAIRILENVAAVIEDIGVKLANKFKVDERDRIRERNDKNTESILSQVQGSDDTSPLGQDLGTDGLDLSLWSLAGTAGLWGAIGGVVLGALKSTAAFIVKALPIAGLATGLFLAVKDAVGGWFSAEAWGVSKLSGMVGGLLGGLDDGAWGAVKNAGKWALIGAGIGSVVPVIGTFVGGLVGAAFGAVLGWFGGEKIAKFLDSIGGFLVEKYEQVKASFWGILGKIREFFKPVTDFFAQFSWENIKAAVAEKIDAFEARIDDTITYLKNLSFSDIKKVFTDSMTSLKESVKEYLSKMVSWDYWFGDEEPVAEVEEPKKPEKKTLLDSNGNPIELRFTRKPLEHLVPLGPGTFLDPERKMSVRENIREIGPDLQSMRQEGIYEQSISNTDNSSKSSTNTVTQSSVTANSNNRTTAVLMSPIGAKNAESAWLHSRHARGDFNLSRW